MNYQSVASDEFDSIEFRGVLGQLLSRAAPVAVALAFGGFAGAWIVHRLPAAAPDLVQPPAANSTAVAAASAANPFGSLFDPRFLGGSAQFSPAPHPSADLYPERVAPIPSIAPRAPDIAPAVPKLSNSPAGEAAPLPPARPAEFVSPTIPSSPARHAGQNGRHAPADATAAPVDNRNFFEKLFGVGRLSEPAAQRASTESAPFGVPRADASGVLARYDRWTAVYDLAAHTVYLPNGARLEAHSGLGDRLDDPAHVNERGRGATPPHLYELEPREQPFHGVQALRLNPVGGGADIFGRAGLLAHTYMLGPNGDSNGCVSFKDYDAFLRAYQNGEVKRLAVVARLD